jgi:tryptophan synthase alpha chain
VLKVVSQVTPTLSAPIVLFSYYNLILNRGVEEFLQQIAAAGVKGLVVPDLPLEESQELLEIAPKYGVEIVLLVAPTSSPERMQAIAEKSQGFIYLVSVTGVTGMRSQVESVVKDRLASLRQVTDKPIGIGFGISQPEHARQVQQWGADAVIVGSAFVKRLADGSPEQGIQAVSDFCQSLKEAISPSSNP